MLPLEPASTRRVSLGSADGPDGVEQNWPIALMRIEVPKDFLIYLLLGFFRLEWSDLSKSESMVAGAQKSCQVPIRDHGRPRHARRVSLRGETIPQWSEPV